MKKETGKGRERNLERVRVTRTEAEELILELVEEDAAALVFTSAAGLQLLAHSRPRSSKGVESFSALLGETRLATKRLLVFAETVKPAGYVRHHLIYELRGARCVAADGSQTPPEADLLCTGLARGFFFSPTLDLSRRWDVEAAERTLFSVNWPLLERAVVLGGKAWRLSLIFGFVTTLRTADGRATLSLLLRCSYDPDELELVALCWRSGAALKAATVSFLRKPAADVLLAASNQRLKGRSVVLLNAQDDSEKDAEQRHRLLLRDLTSKSGVTYCRCDPRAEPPKHVFGIFEAANAISFDAAGGLETTLNYAVLCLLGAEVRETTHGFLPGLFHAQTRACLYAVGLIVGDASPAAIDGLLGWSYSSALERLSARFSALLACPKQKEASTFQHESPSTDYSPKYRLSASLLEKNVSPDFLSSEVFEASPARSERLAPACAPDRREVLRLLQQPGCANGLKLLLLTWNVAGLSPNVQPERLHPLVLRVEDHAPDLLVIGLQEIVELKMNLKNIRSFMLGEEVCRGWRRLFQHCLPQYTVVFSKALVGLQSLVMARRGLCAQSTDVEDWMVRLGTMSLGNKGSISFSVMIEGFLLSFCNCHLTAGSSAEDQLARVADLEDILIELGSVKSRKKFSYSFLFGDLNFKTRLTAPELLRGLRAEGKAYADFCAHDEWTTLLREVSFMQQWQEAPVAFPPTYKFVKGTLELEERGGRAPAWTDRVLFRAETAHLEPLEYSSVPLPLSDHMPVFLCCQLSRR